MNTIIALFVGGPQHGMVQEFSAGTKSVAIPEQRPRRPEFTEYLPDPDAPVPYATIRYIIQTLQIRGSYYRVFAPDYLPPSEVRRLLRTLHPDLLDYAWVGGR